MMLVEFAYRRICTEVVRLVPVMRMKSCISASRKNLTHVTYNVAQNIICRTILCDVVKVFALSETLRTTFMKNCDRSTNFEVGTCRTLKMMITIRDLL